MSDDITSLTNRLRDGEIDGKFLAELVSKGELGKTDRRRIQKNARKPAKLLSERQILRLEVKEKKSKPKLSKEERRRKYLGEIEVDRELKSSKFSICLGCRKKGHILKFCPNVQCESVCFNCGSTDHALRSCPEPRNPDKLPHAKCFTCGQEGHISRDCPENEKGLYPLGGCCHICGDKLHLAKDCPKRPTEEEKSINKKRKFEDEEADNDDAIGEMIMPNSRGDDEINDFRVDMAEDQEEETDENLQVAKKKKNKLKFKKKKIH